MKSLDEILLHDIVASSLVGDLKKSIDDNKNLSIWKTGQEIQTRRDTLSELLNINANDLNDKNVSIF
jgi:hypothetical protein